MTDLYPSRDRRGLLAAIDVGRLYWSNGGSLMWRRDGGQNLRVRARVAELVAAGWVRETGDRQRPYELTDAGRTAQSGGTSRDH